MERLFFYLRQIKSGGERLLTIGEGFKPWRSLLHLIVGVASVLILFLPQKGVIAALGSALILALLFEAIRLRNGRANRWFMLRFHMLVREEEEGKVAGHIYFLIGTLATALIFRREIAATAILFLAVGDVAGVAAGSILGELRLWRGKTVEGAIACFVSCLMIGLVPISLYGMDFRKVVLGAAVATLAELAPIPPDDNLTIPLLSGAAMTLI